MDAQSVCATGRRPPFSGDRVFLVLLCFAALSPRGAAGDFVPRWVIVGELSPFSEERPRLLCRPRKGEEEEG